MEQVLVTGGLGFIGLNLISKLTSEGQYFVHNIDNFSLGHTYFDSFLSKDQKDRVENYRADINERNVVKKILNDHGIRKVFHLAAESHVDRSITGPTAFFQSNVMGTLALLESCREYIEAQKIDHFRFLHVSTDEVFGDLGPDDEPFNEETPYNPSSPYSASKASSDFIIKSWVRTYGFPGVITNCSNNFGPCQNKEKFIPTILDKLHNREKVPVYGNGQNIRDWLFVEDHVSMLLAIVENFQVGESFCLGGEKELSNLDLIEAILKNMQKNGDISPNSNIHNHITYITDRPGHDQRYAIDPSKYKKQHRGNTVTTDFHHALDITISYYRRLNHSDR